MPVPARSWPARGSCASGQPGRPCPTCRFKTSLFRTPSKSSDLRSDAPSRQRSRHRSRPVARSRSQSQRVLAVAPRARRRTARAGERLELVARLKACRAARAETGRAPAADEAGGRRHPRPASRGAAPTDVTRASAFARLRASQSRASDARYGRAAARVGSAACRRTGERPGRRSRSRGLLHFVPRESAAELRRIAASASKRQRATAVRSQAAALPRFAPSSAGARVKRRGRCPLAPGSAAWLAIASLIGS